MTYKRRMEEYSGDNMEVVEEPKVLHGEKKLVLVTHDKSTFYAYDRREKNWLDDKKNPLPKKDQGQSIMVSEFQCACHGTTQRQKWSSQKLFFAGKGRDGYWTSDNMIKQLIKDAITLFELLHPDIKEDKEFDFKNTTFLLDGEPCPQAMYYTKMETITKKKRSVDIPVKYVKGIRSILEECFLWLDTNSYKPGSKWLADCCKDEEPDSRCCAHHFLAAQPDFNEQKTVICEVVEANDHIFEMYLKFHCKCNWIERYWGAAKDLARKESDYTFKSLKVNADSYLDRAGELAKVCRFYNKSWCFIEAYSQNCTGDDAYEKVKQYSARVCASHRKVLKND
ncbi:hypothetical protein PHYBLDRAFT_58381 [Phycomyces blakesleeanus NRRL 1555(-)]|uniref:Uncharacterized protein n=1 Tax=Phycomyces blakesleeanus (strain ATCC 8743b / DSM 1359 / FGSC 10004 / NBRC 33097 / NRRL 1555) TaxID=763407 RepID=A0A162V1B2_PHYB8|nr:hypothetical protein PHYBLDRAFT_58381 [Phycomyces blakesleeanus NRRL 1555(-)]OAD79332.1 hypothetical protein PHYBLDRAFT_58381 [Phycomyces blakesleeanus NRRL 1555(-)]|eukprot:XP_018297372.1 hypothetical protein PHYBLDRAFT_58381 [Phycomyces blakesleeanus NRRL 1555(-)]